MEQFYFIQTSLLFDKFHLREFGEALSWSVTGYTLNLNVTEINKFEIFWSKIKFVVFQKFQKYVFFGPKFDIFSFLKNSKIAIFFGPKLRYFFLPKLRYFFCRNCDIVFQNCDILGQSCRYFKYAAILPLPATAKIYICT